MSSSRYLLIKEDDELLDVKTILQQSLGPVADPPSLRHVLALARCSQLNKAELAQLRAPDDLYNVVSPRNEAAVIANLVALWRNHDDHQHLLTQLHEHTDMITRQWATSDATCTTDDLPPSTHALVDTMSRAGVDTSRCQPAMFNNTMRGMACTQCLQPGDTVVRIPTTLLVSDRTAAASDLVRRRLEDGLAACHTLPRKAHALARFDLDSETLTVIWTLIDSADPDSPHRATWADLPQHIHSGLTMPDEVVDALRATPIHAPLIAARAHVYDAYDRVAPLLQALHAAHPEHVKPEAITVQRWAWACALWYAYSMHVCEAGGDEGPGRACLVPLASYFNHALWPHIVQYGTVQEGAMNFATFRAVAEPGKQLFLGYGAKSNQQLLLYYGFCIAHNPYDTLKLDVPTCSKAENDQVLGALRAKALEHLGLSGSYELTVRGLPPAAETHAAVLAASSATLGDVLAKPAPPGHWQRPPELQALLPKALDLLRPALSRMASQWRLEEARRAVEALDDGVGALREACLVYVDGVAELLQVLGG